VWPGKKSAFRRRIAATATDASGPTAIAKSGAKPCARRARGSRLISASGSAARSIAAV
jgi:hypothetical protein